MDTQQTLLQNVFDRVWVHLNKQGMPAIDAGACVYLAPNGNMCAVGCLLDRSKITGYIEEMTVRAFFEAKDRLDGQISNFSTKYKEKAKRLKKALEDSGLSTDNSHLMYFLISLQKAHDDAPTIDWLSDWRAQMVSIAAKHKLIVRPVEFTLPT